MGGCASNKFEQALRIDVRLPYIEMAHVPELPHALTIRLQAIQCCLPVTGSREAVLPPGDHDAGDQSLHIPLPGTRQSLVKIIHIENLVSLRRCIGSEVGDVSIAAG